MGSESGYFGIPEWEDAIVSKVDFHEAFRHGLPLQDFFDDGQEDYEELYWFDPEFRLSSVSEDEDEYFDGSDHDESDDTVQLEEGHDICEEEQKRPLVKRAKRSTNADGTVWFGQNHTEDFKTITSLPVNIIHEISSRLHPVALRNLSRTSKTLWAILLSRNAASAWRTTLRLAGAPECPPDISEPKWVNFLYGSTCEICSKQKTHFFDTSLCRRACAFCLPERLISDKDFASTFPDLDPELQDLVPHTKYDHMRYFWKPDLRAAAMKLEAIRKISDINGPSTLEDWKKARKASVEAMMKRGRQCITWMEERCRLRHIRTVNRCSRRGEEIIRRLTALGHTDLDQLDLWQIDNVYFNFGPEVTEEEWADIRHDLEEEVQERWVRYNKACLAAERRRLVSGQETKIYQIYGKYWKTLAPALWNTLPHPAHVFSIFLPDDSQKPLKELDYMTVPDEIVSYISDHKERRRLPALSLLPATTDVSSCSDDRLHLATAAFFCQSRICSTRSPTYRYPLIGWVDIDSHPYCLATSSGWPRWSQLHPGRSELAQPDIVYSERGAAAASALVKLHNLDPMKATPQQLDVHEYRFICLDCPMAKCTGSQNGRLALPWRECISHYVDPNMLESHQSPNWMLLPQGVATEIKQRELDLSGKEQQWSCNRCAVHMDAPCVLRTVIEHLKNNHYRSDPIEGTDYIHLMPSLRSRKVLQGYPLDKPVSKPTGRRPAEYRCMICPEWNQHRFTKDGVIQHIETKHGVQIPIEKVNFCCCR